MPIAKEQIKIGFVIVANPGSYVSKAAVKENGWEKLVDDGPDLSTDEGSDAAAPKGKPQVGSV